MWRGWVCWQTLCDGCRHALQVNAVFLLLDSEIAEAAPSGRVASCREFVAAEWRLRCGSEGEDEFTGLNAFPIREGDYIHTKLVNYKNTDLFPSIKYLTKWSLFINYSSTTREKLLQKAAEQLLSGHRGQQWTGTCSLVWFNDQITHRLNPASLLLAASTLSSWHEVTLLLIRNNVEVNP